MWSRNALSRAVRKVVEQQPEFRLALRKELRTARVDPDLLALQRSFHLPNELRGIKPLTPEGTDLAIWSWTDPRTERLHAIAFKAKQSKPLWQFWFRNEADRKKRIEDTIAVARSAKQRKLQEQEDRRKFQHGLVVGSILYSSWGWEQTNINFYQVTGVKGKTVELRAIASNVVNSDGPSDYVVPIPNRFSGPVLKKIPQRGNTVNIERSRTAYPWEGKPLRTTNPMYGY